MVSRFRLFKPFFPPLLIVFRYTREVNDTPNHARNLHNGYTGANGDLKLQNNPLFLSSIKNAEADGACAAAMALESKGWLLCLSLFLF